MTKALFPLICMLLFVPCVAIAQQHNQGASKGKPTPPMVFTYVEKMPDFPGDLNEYLRHNIKYPDSALVHDIQGKVVVSFIVRKDGSIDSVHTTRSVNPYLDAEAVRVIKQMPNWIPGKQGGTPVNVYFTMPIKFTLE